MKLSKRCKLQLLNGRPAKIGFSDLLPVHDRMLVDQINSDLGVIFVNKVGALIVYNPCNCMIMQMSELFNELCNTQICIRNNG